MNSPMVVSLLSDCEPALKDNPVQVACGWCEMSMWSISDNAFVVTSMQPKPIICRDCALENNAEVTVSDYMRNLTRSNA